MNEIEPWYNHERAAANAEIARLKKENERLIENHDWWMNIAANRQWQINDNDAAYVSQHDADSKKIEKLEQENETLRRRANLEKTSAARLEHEREDLYAKIEDLEKASEQHEQAHTEQVNAYGKVWLRDVERLEQEKQDLYEAMQAKIAALEQEKAQSEEDAYWSTRAHEAKDREIRGYVSENETLKANLTEAEGRIHRLENAVEYWKAEYRKERGDG